MCKVVHMYLLNVILFLLPMILSNSPVYLLFDSLTSLLPHRKLCQTRKVRSLFRDLRVRLRYGDAPPRLALGHILRGAPNSHHVLCVMIHFTMSLLSGKG